ncbi:ferric reductase-like transmembrane domain-containing protein [Patescibacteria group bacterium]
MTPRSKKTIVLVAIITYLIILILPFIIIDRSLPDGLRSSLNASPEIIYLTLVRLFGLLAFSIIFTQIVIGAFRKFFVLLFSPLWLRIHLILGIVAVIIALTHPVLLIMNDIRDNSLDYLWLLPDFSSQTLLWQSLGPLALYLIIITAITALLRKKIKLWRKLHLLNYLIFFLAFFHSWNIGSDLQINWVKTVWLIYLITVTIALLYRLKFYISKKRKSPVNYEA